MSPARSTDSPSQSSGDFSEGTPSTGGAASPRPAGAPPVAAVDCGVSPVPCRHIEVKEEPLHCSSTSPQLTPPPEEKKKSLPIGLKLTITPSFVELAQQSRASSRTSTAVGGGATPGGMAMHCNDVDRHKEKLKASNGGMAMHCNDVDRHKEKLKASNFPASLLRIGSWERRSLNEGDLVVKCYFAKHRLVWEILDGGLKSKMEILWNNISAIRATSLRDKSILEVELDCFPSFSHESDPQPRKHTRWRSGDDFTGGQALTCRRHYIEFQEGILEKHYEKLMECDSRLRGLSGKPFPSANSPYFPLKEGSTEDLSYNMDIQRSAILSDHSQAFQYNLPIMVCQNSRNYPNQQPQVLQSITSMGRSLGDHGIYNHQCISNKARVFAEEDYLGKSYPTQEVEVTNLTQVVDDRKQLEAIEEHLMSDQELSVQVDEQKILARVKSMDSILQLDNGGNNGQLCKDYKQDGCNSFNKSTIR